MDSPLTSSVAPAALGSADFPFCNAIAAYITAPSEGTLARLNQAARTLLPAPVGDGWHDAETVDWSVVGNVSEIRVRCTPELTGDEIPVLAKALSFALEETLQCAPLGESTAEYGEDGKDGADDCTIIEFAYDASSSGRVSPSYARAFEVASVYVFHGSKIRTTNYDGQGTRGTQAVKGIGPGRATVEFFVR